MGKRHLYLESENGLRKTGSSESDQGRPNTPMGQTSSDIVPISSNIHFKSHRSVAQHLLGANGPQRRQEGQHAAQTIEKHQLLQRSLRVYF
jgi:hypothetical protein